MYKPFIPVKDLRAAYYMEDFLGSTYNGMNFATRSAGTPTVAMESATELSTNGGSVRITPSSTNADYVELYQPFQILNVSKDIYFSTRVRIVTPVQNTVIYVGIVAASPNNQNNCIGFSTWRTTSGNPNWDCNSTSVGTATTVDSGVAASGWQELSFAASSDTISYWINGNHVTTITANIPTANLGSSARVDALATGVVTNRYLPIDYIEVYTGRV